MFVSRTRGVPVPDLNERQVLITGAASGIGRAAAESAAAQGATVHLTDVREASLEAAAGRIRAAGGAVGVVRPADVAAPDQVRALAREVHRSAGPMDVVANVAGIAAWGTVRGMEQEEWRRLVEVNLMGPIHVITEFVPAMIDGGNGGHLVNVASAAGIIGMPWHAAYSAGKFGLRGVSEVLRFDLRRHGIGVSLVCPGAVDTGLVDTVRIAGVDAQGERFRRAQRGFRRAAVSPERAAEAMWRGVRRNRYWVYTSADIRFAHWGQRHAPWGYQWAMRAMNAGANRALPEVGAARRADLR